MYLNVSECFSLIPQSSGLLHRPSTAACWWGQRSEPPHSADLSSQWPPDLCCRSNTDAAEEAGRRNRKGRGDAVISGKSKMNWLLQSNWEKRRIRSSSYLDGVQRDVRPVQAVPVIVKVQCHGFPKANQWQRLVGAGGQVVAVDGVPHSIQDKLITLCETKHTLIQVRAFLM